ncbi:MAG TPA: protein translocase subunit SecD, partial [Cyanobium sp.]|nr:protein translocase subunit SecD [Cyanobium sp.]
MARQQGWLALILALAIAAGALLATFGLQLGLDLRGGSQLTLQVMPAGSIKKVEKEQLEAVKEVLERRINGLGVAESTLQTVGDDKLVLQLPGEQDPTRAAKVLGSTALLEFKAQKPGTEKEMEGLLPLKRQVERVLAYRSRVGGEAPVDGATPAPKPELSADDRTKAFQALGLTLPEGSDEIQQLEALQTEVNRRLLALFGPTLLTGKDLTSAGRQQQQNGTAWDVTLGFNRQGGEKFAALTQSIAGTGRVLGIVLDGRSISEATVGPEFKAAGISGGAASITGNFTAEEARDLEVQLRGGSLPLPVKIVEVRTVGPSLGAENIRRSLAAGLAGLALVGVFMALVYRLPGIVAVLALSLYSLFNLAIYSLIPVTLTLPGIAGFILSVGMAVDANVLIFERVKEELRSGNTLIRSIDTGFSRAFSSIFDGHITGLISCAALFFLGTGLVKGFAVTLAIGLLL